MKILNKIGVYRLAFYILLLAALYIEASYFGIFGIEPCFVLPCIICGAFYLNEKEIIAVSLIAGIILDLQTLYTGLNAIVFTLVITALVFLINSYLNRNVVTFAIVSFGIIFTVIMISAIFYLFIAQKANFFEAFFGSLLPKTVFSLIVAMIFYGIFNQLGRFTAKNKRK